MRVLECYCGSPVSDHPGANGGRRESFAFSFAPENQPPPRRKLLKSLEILSGSGGFIWSNRQMFSVGSSNVSRS